MSLKSDQLEILLGVHVLRENKEKCHFLQAYHKVHIGMLTS